MAARRRRPPAASFFARPPELVAPELLNKVLACGGRSGRIVEVEAYGGRDDPASHAHRGPTPRAATMFGPAGRLYVYRSYGIHWCANVVAHGAGPDLAGAVLVRAVEPLDGVGEMWSVRPAARLHTDLASGPGKVCQALGIVGAHDGVDLRAPGAPVQVLDDGVAPPERPDVGPRVGISRATEVPWRFSVAGHAHRSRAR